MSVANELLQSVHLISITADPIPRRLWGFTHTWALEREGFQPSPVQPCRWAYPSFIDSLLNWRRLWGGFTMAFSVHKVFIFLILIKQSWHERHQKFFYGFLAFKEKDKYKARAVYRSKSCRPSNGVKNARKRTRPCLPLYPLLHLLPGFHEMLLPFLQQIIEVTY